MTQLTNQQIYDNALFGIRSQDYQQSRNGSHCAYRGTSDTGRTLKCAVGWNISDEDGQRWDCGSNDASGTSIAEMAHGYREIYSKYFTSDHLTFLEDLQKAHDTYLPDAKKFESRMQLIATAYDLIYTPVQEG